MSRDILDPAWLFLAFGSLAFALAGGVTMFVQSLQRQFRAWFWGGVAATLPFLLVVVLPEYVDSRSRARLEKWAAEPPRTDLPRQYDGDGLYMPYVHTGDDNICDFHSDRPAPYPYCLFQPARFLTNSPIRFLETGTDPIYRWRWLAQDARCFSDRRLPGGWGNERKIWNNVSSSAQGGCLIAEMVAQAEAGAELRVTPVEAPLKLDWHLAVRVEMIDRAEGTVLDETYLYHGEKRGDARFADGPIRAMIDQQRGYAESVLDPMGRRVYFHPGVFDNALFRQALATLFGREAIREVCNLGYGHETLLSAESRAVLDTLARGEAVDGLDTATLQPMAERCVFPDLDH